LFIILKCSHRRIMYKFIFNHNLAKFDMYMYTDIGDLYGSPIHEALPSYVRRFPGLYYVIIVPAQGCFVPRRCRLVWSPGK
jgi:hypothetical protein